MTPQKTHEKLNSQCSYYTYLQRLGQGFNVLHKSFRGLVLWLRRTENQTPNPGFHGYMAVAQLVPRQISVFSNRNNTLGEFGENNN